MDNSTLIASVVASLEPIKRLSKDLKVAASVLGRQEARFLVDAYYQMQADRMRNNNQVRATEQSGEPNEVLGWFADQSETMEKQIARALDSYSASEELGQWARSQVGVGPVIAAGLLAYIDITDKPTAGHIWSFAGLIPGQKKEKGKILEWNANLKTLCWKIGESFVKTSGHDDSFYGKIYAQAKERETERNEAGMFADQAKTILETKNFTTDTIAKKHYAAGKLPPAHIHARAKRWAVKLFLSHYHAVGFELLYGFPPPKPYAIAILGHAHYIPPPLWESKSKSLGEDQYEAMFDVMREARESAKRKA